MTVAVRVRTPCRLHFGMFSFGRPDRAQFGGVGAMIESPSVEVEIVPSDSFIARGVLADRTRQVAELLVDRWKLPSLPNCEIAVHSPRDHTGLGVGTQLHLAVAAGLRRYLGSSEMAAEELSVSTGRGNRSALGTYGFKVGGLIVDAGKEPGDSIGKLSARVALPETWRFVLFCQPEERGLAGAREVAAFEQLRPVPDDITRRLWSITEEEMLPAVEQRDCRMFGDAVYRFGRLAGECFASAQSGPFATREIGELVGEIREFDVSGVGQSSWGPTVFAIAEGDEEARSLVERVHKRRAGIRYESVIARPNNTGAIVETFASSLDDAARN